MDNELLSTKIAAMEGTPFGPQEVEAMSRTLSPSIARYYGLARVARVWKVPRASVYRSLKETQPNTTVALVQSAHVRTRNWRAISASK